MTLSRSGLAKFEERFQAGDHRRMFSEDIRAEADVAVPLILFEESRFELDTAALEKILLHEDVKDRNVVVLSVAGAFRKGKSFILNFFLRYLYHTYGSEVTVDADWMGSDDQPLRGFSWKGGSERDTAGILMWSKVFLATTKEEEKIAIILIDTQGTFDSGSTVRECAIVFALSTLISSIQVYNLSQNIQEDDLQHLQLFSDYGKLAMQDTGSIPFQRLQFLVRDWFYTYEAAYGEDGGRKFLQKRLSVLPKQAPELQDTRRRIKSCFSEIGCFLMPFPGKKVTSNPHFDGRLSDIDEDFRTSLRELVTSLLSPENLLIKEICGQKIKAKDLIQYFHSYVSAFGGEELPEPKSLLAATAEANNLAALAAAKDIYSSQMEEICKSHLSSQGLIVEHTRMKVEALEDFNLKRKMGGEEFSEKYRIQLESDIEEMFQQFKRYNQMKSSTTHAPGVALGIFAIFYFLSGVFSMLFLYTLANICNLIMCVSLLTLIVWTYSKCSGGLEEIGDIIDYISVMMWECVFKPTYNAALNRTIKQVVNTALPCEDKKSK
uniref:Atlastin n=1 Tax=Lygus hesperus TaxID=30085 RepID=A0A0A9X2L0_LYGHE